MRTGDGVRFAAAGKGGCRADQGKSVAVLTMTIVADATLESLSSFCFMCLPARLPATRIGCGFLASGASGGGWGGGGDGQSGARRGEVARGRRGRGVAARGRGPCRHARLVCEP